MDANFRMLQQQVQQSQRVKRQECNTKYEVLKQGFYKAKEAVRVADDAEDAYNNSGEG